MIKRFAIAVLVLCLMVSGSYAQSEDNLTKAINGKLIPVTWLTPGDDFSDLDPVKNLLKDKAIIGIGEATHGTHEFFVFKHRMLEFLVKEMGFRILVIEADFSGTQAMNDFVVNGKGSAELAIWNMGFSGTTQEFVALANWAKSYNDTQSPENKVRFYGCDMQYGVFAANAIKKYLAQHNLLTPELNTGFDALNKFMPTLTTKDKAAIRNTVAALADVQFSDQDTTQNTLYKRDVRELQQCADYMDAQSKMLPAKQSDLRDRFMAENCEWIYRHNRSSKMMIWAHNEHIRKSEGSDGFHRMGIILADSLKDRYYAMGFDFYSGKMRSFDATVKKNIAVDLPSAKERSSGAIFAKCSASNFILDFKTASTDPAINSFLNHKMQSSFYGAGFSPGQAPHYVTHKLAETYDAIIFIRETNAAVDIR